MSCTDPWQHRRGKRWLGYATCRHCGRKVAVQDLVPCYAKPSGGHTSTCHGWGPCANFGDVVGPVHAVIGSHHMRPIA